MTTIERLAMAVVGPWHPVPPGSPYTLDELRAVRWRNASSAERGAAIQGVLAALRVLKRADNDALEAMHQAMFVDKFDGGDLPMLNAGFGAAIDAVIAEHESQDQVFGAVTDQQRPDNRPPVSMTVHPESRMNWPKR